MTVLEPFLKSLQSRGKSAPLGLSYDIEGGNFGLDVVFPDTLQLDEARMGVSIPFADGHAYRRHTHGRHRLGTSQCGRR